jgi:hypothetical protein
MRYVDPRSQIRYELRCTPAGEPQYVALFDRHDALLATTPTVPRPYPGAAYQEEFVLFCMRVARDRFMESARLWENAYAATSARCFAGADDARNAVERGEAPSLCDYYDFADTVIPSGAGLPHKCGRRVE